MNLVGKVLRRFENVAQILRREAVIPIGYRLDQTRSYPTTRGVGDFLARNVKLSEAASTMRSLDLGCGEQPRNPFKTGNLFGVDIRGGAEKNILTADLSVSPIPFPDRYFDYVTAFDFIEHIPRFLYLGKTIFPFVELMNEIDRVLKDGGLFLSHTPAYPSKQAFQDPTHVNIITEDTFPKYFCGDENWGKMYGFRGNFELVAQEWYTFLLLTVLRKKQ